MSQRHTITLHGKKLERSIGSSGRSKKAVSSKNNKKSLDPRLPAIINTHYSQSVNCKGGRR
jgi:hypothetical protein